MALQFTSRIATAEGQQRWRLLPLVATTALTLATVAGVGAWQLRAQHPTGRAGSGALPRSEAVPATDQAMVQPRLVRQGSGDVVHQGSTYLYLVGSEAHGTLVRQLLDEGDRVRIQAGDPPAVWSVLVTEGMDPTRFFTAVDMFATAVSGGVVVDLRAP